MDHYALIISAFAAVAAVVSVVNTLVTNRRKEDRASDARAHGYLRNEVRDCHDRMNGIENDVKTEFNAVRKDMHGLGEQVQHMGQQLAELTVNIKHLFNRQGIQYQEVDK